MEAQTFELGQATARKGIPEWQPKAAMVRLHEEDRLPTMLAAEPEASVC